MHKDSPFSRVSDQTWQAFWPEGKVIHSKYYKKQLSDLASTIDFGCVSLFWQKKGKIINFLSIPQHVAVSHLVPYAYGPRTFGPPQLVPN